ncbi:hypothetical protein OPV22_026159 [Ensete ventricosum]|uniref:Uncharacterized protein n=1 Tax=Ensete ventricosum TaxID=4639 RepID=A0AAV8Q9F3_ENSVE|nr:hypothetical protein OPV22_026159 [Ensete ventricosum]
MDPLFEKIKWKQKAPLIQGGRRLRGLWLIIIINSRNSFGVGPLDQKLLLHVTPGRDKKWHSKPLSGYVMDKWSPWTLRLVQRQNCILVQL